MKKKQNPFKTNPKVHKVWHEFCDYFKRWYFEYHRSIKKLKDKKDGSYNEALVMIQKYVEVE